MVPRIWQVLGPDVVVRRSRRVIAAMLATLGTIGGSVLALVIGTEEVVHVHFSSSMDSTYENSTSYLVPAPLWLIGLGGLIGFTVAAIVAIRWFRRQGPR